MQNLSTNVRCRSLVAVAAEAFLGWFKAGVGGRSKCCVPQ